MCPCQTPKVPLIHVQQPAAKCPPNYAVHIVTEANSSQLSKACIHCVAAADADNCHVLKTATMHSLLMTNARGDLISVVPPKQNSTNPLTLSSRHPLKAH